jgi:hypothetical protein
VDLPLWDVGGDGEGMELARERFRTFLHSLEAYATAEVG